MGPKLCPKLCPKRKTLYLCDRFGLQETLVLPLNPTLVPHFGRPLGGPRRAWISSRVPEIAQFSLSCFPPQKAPPSRKTKPDLLPLKSIITLGTWGDGHSHNENLDGKRSAGRHTFSPISGVRLPSQRHLFASSSPKAPVLTTSLPRSTREL